MKNKSVGDYVKSGLVAAVSFVGVAVGQRVLGRGKSYLDKKLDNLEKKLNKQQGKQEDCDKGTDVSAPVEGDQDSPTR